MKKLSLLLAVSIAATVLCSTIATAQEKEKVVTGTINFLIPSLVEVLDQYLSGQLYTDESLFTGVNVKIGAFYKKHDNLSWNLYYTGYNKSNGISGLKQVASLTNPANSQNLQYSSYTVGYGTYYHWQFAKKLMIKAGGMADLYGAMKKTTPDGVNNHLNIEGHMMLKAHAAIRYGWDFKKWGLDLRAHATLPLFGVITADHPSEPALSILASNDHSVMNSAYNHIFFASYHNYMSFDYELGVDFVLKPCTLTLGFGNTSKYWNIYDIQNIRKINYMTLGVAFDIVSRDKFKSSNKNF